MTQCHQIHRKRGKWIWYYCCFFPKEYPYIIYINALWLPKGSFIWAYFLKRQPISYSHELIYMSQPYHKNEIPSLCLHQSPFTWTWKTPHNLIIRACWQLRIVFSSSFSKSYSHDSRPKQSIWWFIWPNNIEIESKHKNGDFFHILMESNICNIAPSLLPFNHIIFSFKTWSI